VIFTDSHGIGPDLAPGEAPWPVRWEDDPRCDSCLHEWESVLLRPYPARVEEAIRCRHCHTPRCGDSRDSDPCMRRRHHRGDHVLASGVRYPLGGTP